MRAAARFNWYRHLILPSLLGAAVLAAVALYAGAGEFASHVGQVPLAVLPMVLGLALVNYSLRCLRWMVYLRRLDIRSALALQGEVFMAGLAMSVSPGKVGEFLKALWLNALQDAPLSRTGAAVLMERLMDVLAVALLSLGALSLVDWSPVVVGIVAGAAVSLGVIAAVAPVARRRLGSLLRRRWPQGVDVAYQSLRALLGPRALSIGVPLSLAAWLSEGMALWVILDALGSDVPVAQAVGIYALATLAGAVSMLPGGLGSTEASLVALLAVASVPVPAAAAATVLVRAATLWFALALGLVALPLLFRSLRRHARPSRQGLPGNG